MKVRNFLACAMATAGARRLQQDKNETQGTPGQQ